MIENYKHDIVHYWRSGRRLTLALELADHHRVAIFDKGDIREGFQPWYAQVVSPLY